MKKFMLLLLFATMPLSIAACTCSEYSDSNMDNAAPTEGASIYKPGDCFTLNNCRGPIIANLPSEEECVRRNGNSWVNEQAQCLRDIDQD